MVAAPVDIPSVSALAHVSRAEKFPCVVLSIVFAASVPAGFNESQAKRSHLVSVELSTLMSRQPVPVQNRFWDKARITGPEACWEWARSRFPNGYGQIQAHGKPTQAHRVAWELTRGPIPDGMCVLHHCDNPPCVNPSHLWIGTHRDNNADRDQKGRHRSALGSAHGHAKLDESSVVAILRLHAKGISQRTLAFRYGVSTSIISEIVNGILWTHVPRP